MRSYRYLLVRFPYHLIKMTSFAKLRYIALELRPVEMFGYFIIGFTDA